jgi:uncharacterized membrane protein YqiK
MHIEFIIIIIVVVVVVVVVASFLWWTGDLSIATADVPAVLAGDDI